MIKEDQPTYNWEKQTKRAKGQHFMMLGYVIILYNVCLLVKTQYMILPKEQKFHPEMN